MKHSISELLDELQQQMQRQQVWQTEPPAADKLMSRLPFSVDTLSFLEWLQWIYIARLRALLEADSPLPKGAQVFPYAEEALKEQVQEYKALLMLIYRLDLALK